MYTYETVCETSSKSLQTIASMNIYPSPSSVPNFFHIFMSSVSAVNYFKAEFRKALLSWNIGRGFLEGKVNANVPDIFIMSVKLSQCLLS